MRSYTSASDMLMFGDVAVLSGFPESRGIRVRCKPQQQFRAALGRQIWLLDNWSEGDEKMRIRAKESLRGVRQTNPSGRLLTFEMGMGVCRLEKRSNR
jgi:hypothetical protein